MTSMKLTFELTELKNTKLELTFCTFIASALIKLSKRISACRIHLCSMLTIGSLAMYTQKKTKTAPKIHARGKSLYEYRYFNIKTHLIWQNKLIAKKVFHSNESQYVWLYSSPNARSSGSSRVYYTHITAYNTRRQTI